jgi:hypothetical protein
MPVSFSIDRDVVDVELARDAGLPRRVDRVVAVEGLPRSERVLEAPELIERAQVEGRGGGVEAHDALERALEDRQAAARLEPDEEDLRRLVGGEDDARALRGKPGGEVGRR